MLPVHVLGLFGGKNIRTTSFSISLSSFFIARVCPLLRCKRKKIIIKKSRLLGFFSNYFLLVRVLSDMYEHIYIYIIYIQRIKYT